MEGIAWERDRPQEDGIDRGEVRTVHATTHAAIKASGVSQCKDGHNYFKLTENEVGCGKCPSAWIVNPEVLDSMLAK